MHSFSLAIRLHLSSVLTFGLAVALLTGLLVPAAAPTASAADYKQLAIDPRLAIAAYSEPVLVAYDEPVSAREGDAQTRTVGAIYGDLDAHLAYADAAEAALHAAIVVTRRIEAGTATSADLEHLPVLVAEADESWRSSLASYAVDRSVDQEATVFVRLHDRIALRLMMQLMRPRFERAGDVAIATRLDPVSARWIAEGFHATVSGDLERARVVTRLLRERAGFVSREEREALLGEILRTVREIDDDLYAANVSAGDALIDAIVPGLGAIAIDDPCSPENVEDPRTSSASSQGHAKELDALGISAEDLAAQAKQDCAAAGGTDRRDPTGYGSYTDAMNCLGELLGATEEPTDYGMCMAAGIGATEPGEIGASTTRGATDCSNPLGDGADKDKYPPRDLKSWYDENFVQPKQNPPGIYEPPEDEDKKRREEINAANDDATIVRLDGGLLEKIGTAIVDAIVAIVEWVADLFSSDEPEATSAADPTDPADDQGDGGDGSDDETPDPPEGDGDNTLPGDPDGVGGSGGCQDPWVELAESCLDRMLDQIPGGDRDSDLYREPGELDPRLAYIWEGSPVEGAEEMQSCGGAITPTNSMGCEQLTDPPTACNDPGITEAAIFFGEEAERELYCQTARCDSGSHCECLDGPLGQEPPPLDSPLGGPEGPGDPADPGVTLDGTTDRIRLGTSLDADVTQIQDVRDTSVKSTSLLLMR